MNTFLQAYQWYSQLVRNTSQTVLGFTVDPLLLALALAAAVVVVIAARSLTSHK